MTSSPPTSLWERAARRFEPTGVDRWFDDFGGFCLHAIRWRPGDGPTPYQLEIADALVEHRRVAVRGPHGLGKTALMALAVHWFSVTRENRGVDWKIVTTAGAWRQLTRYLWPEIRKWTGRLDWDEVGRQPYNRHNELLALNLNLRHGQAFAVASSDPQLIEGAHADEILYLFDESKAIIAATFDAAEGALSIGNAYAMAFSTPGVPAGRFYEIHSRRPGTGDWWVRHVTKQEVQAAGRMDPTWAENRRQQWGETSAIYANRVLGEFHTSDEDSVIPLEWIEAAVERWHAWNEGDRRTTGPAAVGVDPARFGDDLTAIATKIGPIVTDVTTYARADTMATTGRVIQALNATPRSLAIVDSIGIGAGVVDRLREQGHRVFAFNAGSATERTDTSGSQRFVNKRSAAWWGLRELLDPSAGATLALPPDDALVGDLTAPRYAITSQGGRIKVEAKEDIVKRIGHSPDRGDAVMQACWVEGDTGGQGEAVPWNTAPSGVPGGAVRWDPGVSQWH